MASTPVASSVRFRVWVFDYPECHFFDDLAQALLIGQREIEILDQAAEFGGIAIEGAVRIKVRRLVENFCPTSRSGVQ